MTDHFVILTLLILAHVVGDFYLQTSRSIKSKSSQGVKTSILANLRHAALSHPSGSYRSVIYLKL